MTRSYLYGKLARFLRCENGAHLIRLACAIVLTAAIVLFLSHLWSAPNSSVNKISWLGWAAPDFGEGTGTSEAPYQIDSAERLTRLAYVVNRGIEDSDGVKFSEKYYAQTADIDLDIHAWTPIGGLFRNQNSRNESAFQGHFNGNGYSISNVRIGDNITMYDFGLFGRISDAVITNVNLIGINIQVTRGTVGGLAGRVGEGGIIENCTAEGNVNFKHGNNVSIGGLAGENQGVITGCKANVSVSRSGGINTLGGGTGGLIGINYGTVKDSIASGSVTICDLSPLHKAIANALIGNNDNKGTVINSNGNGRVRFTYSLAWRVALIVLVCLFVFCVIRAIKCPLFREKLAKFLVLEAVTLLISFCIFIAMIYVFLTVAEHNYYTKNPLSIGEDDLGAAGAVLGAAFGVHLLSILLSVLVHIYIFKKFFIRRIEKDG